MHKLALSAATFALTFGSIASALADRAPNADERAAIEAALGAQGYSSWKEIELDDGRWEVDDAIAADGKRYDLKLDQNFSIVSKELED